MHSRANELPKSSETASRRQPDETPLDPYHGIELAPITLDSLVTWDVSGHARREQDRLHSANRMP
jgi:hypothetical protein